MEHAVSLLLLVALIYMWFLSLDDQQMLEKLDSQVSCKIPKVPRYTSTVRSKKRV